MGNRTSKGKAIANVVQISTGEKVQAILPVEQLSDSQFVVMLTQKELLRRPLDAFSNPRQAGIIALTTDLEDRVISAKYPTDKVMFLLPLKKGMSIRFNESDVRPMGRAARGVKGLLCKMDDVIGMEVIAKNSKDTILMVTESGYGKRSEVDEYRVQSRGGVGIITQKRLTKAKRCRHKTSYENQEVILSTDQGQVIRMKVSGISVLRKKYPRSSFNKSR